MGVDCVPWLENNVLEFLISVFYRSRMYSVGLRNWVQFSMDHKNNRDCRDDPDMYILYFMEDTFVPGSAILVQPCSTPCSTTACSALFDALV